MDMSTKEKLLALLQEHKGEFFSGAQIAETLNVSRTAVWKAANSLRNAGYSINAVQNKGYSLDARTDVLSEAGIRQYLLPEYRDLHMDILPVADSTNAQLREKANGGTEDGCILIANEQTKGRGRLGRDFYSPPDTGVYLSILLRPDYHLPSQAVKITTMAATAASEAIEEVTLRPTGIKWVNDIFMNGKKVSGILTEASFNLENGRLDYIILGIGMNAYAPPEGFPGELSRIAGSIFYEQVEDGKNRLAAAFLNHFLGYYRSPDPDRYAEKYREKSILIGRQVTVITPSSQRSAYVLDVDKNCRLIVRYEDGEVEQLTSAEISVYL